MNEKPIAAWIRAVVLGTASFVAYPAYSNDSLAQAIEALGDYNYPKAIPLIRISAEQGNMHAQEMLGLMLIHGEALYASAIEPDRAEALHWLAKAAENGSVIAQHLLSAWAKRGHSDAQQAMDRITLQPRQ